MAQVELVVTEPARIVALVTRDAVEELGLKKGMAATAIVKSTNVMVAELMKRLLLVTRAVRYCSRGRPPLATQRRGTTKITVYAASSLTNVFRPSTRTRRYSFGGSNSLATQIENGAPADVFASANMTLPPSSTRAGTARSLVVFTRNTLVIVVPSANPAQHQEHLQPHEVGRHGRRCRARRPRRHVHAADPQQHELERRGATRTWSARNSVCRGLGARHRRRRGRRLRLRRRRPESVPGQVKVIKIPAWAQPKVQYVNLRRLRRRRTRTRTRPRATPSSSGRAEHEGPARVAQVTASFRVKPAPRHHRHRHRRPEDVGDEGPAGRRPVRSARGRGCDCLFSSWPIVGIFFHTTPGRVISQLSNPVVDDAFVVTLKTSVIAQVLVVVVGTPTAYLLATRRFVGRSLAITLVELPLVLPPAVAGIGLLVSSLRPHTCLRAERQAWPISLRCSNRCRHFYNQTRRRQGGHQRALPEPRPASFY